MKENNNIAGNIKEIERVSQGIKIGDLVKFVSIYYLYSVYEGKIGIVLKEDSESICKLVLFGEKKCWISVLDLEKISE